MSGIWKIGLFEKDGEKGICLDCQKQKRAKYVFECKIGSTKALLTHLFSKLHKDSIYHKEYSRLQEEVKVKKERASSSQQTLDQCIERQGEHSGDEADISTYEGPEKGETFYI